MRKGLPFPPHYSLKHKKNIINKNKTRIINEIIWILFSIYHR